MGGENAKRLKELFCDTITISTTNEQRYASLVYKNCEIFILLLMTTGRRKDEFTGHFPPKIVSFTLIYSLNI
jgi:hypothetical protein